MYVPVVTLSTENDKKLLEQLKSGFKRTIKWNKYRLQMTIQSNNNLNYLIDPTYLHLFVLSFARNPEGDHKDSFSHYYAANIEIKDFNDLIDGKGFFDLSIINEEERSLWKNYRDSKNNDYATCDLLDLACFRENYRLITIDFSKQTKLKDPQQINFIGRLERQTPEATMFFCHWKNRRNYFWVFKKFCQYLIKIEKQKIVNLSNSSENEYSKFVTKKWFVIDSESKGNYSHENPIKFLTKSIESSLCDYSDAYVLVTGNSGW